MVDISNDFWLGKCTCIQGIFGTHHLLSKPNLASSKPNLASNVASSESNEAKVKEIDWEQRRYEVAKELYTNSRIMSAEEAIEYADTLINALKSKTE